MNFKNPNSTWWFGLEDTLKIKSGDSDSLPLPNTAIILSRTHGAELCFRHLEKVESWHILPCCQVPCSTSLHVLMDIQPQVTRQDSPTSRGGRGRGGWKMSQSVPMPYRGTAARPTAGHHQLSQAGEWKAAGSPRHRELTGFRAHPRAPGHFYLLQTQRRQNRSCFIAVPPATDPASPAPPGWGRNVALTALPGLAPPA